MEIHLDKNGHEIKRTSDSWADSRSDSVIETYLSEDPKVARKVAKAREEELCKKGFTDVSIKPYVDDSDFDRPRTVGYIVGAFKETPEQLARRMAVEKKLKKREKQEKKLGRVLDWEITDECVAFKGSQVTIVEEDTIDLANLKEDLINGEFTYQEAVEVYRALPRLVNLANRIKISVVNLPTRTPTKEEYPQTEDD